MIVDCHVNVWEDSHALPLSRTHVKPRTDVVQLSASPERVKAAMQGVDRYIAFTLRYADSVGIEGDDAATARLMALDPGRCVGFAYADPRRPDAMELLRHATGTLGLRGVKFGPIYNGVGVLDGRLEPIVAHCLRHDLPLTMHMGTTFAENAPLEFGRPIHVDALAARYPELKIVMAHMGHPWVDECIAVIRKNRNVYAEVSALYYRPWQFWNMLISAQEYGVADRGKIFWGTDFPYTEVEESLDGLRRANHLVEGTALPRVSDATIAAITHADPFQHWWHGTPP
ncbi:MAG: amidohydrolase family protein [Acetobacteraceae bacterium]|nr:amidohydrolase family protein [Acetobacteraceae bacterium]